MEKENGSINRLSWILTALTIASCCGCFQKHFSVNDVEKHYGSQIGELATLAEKIAVRNQSQLLPIKNLKTSGCTWDVPGIVQVSIGLSSTEPKYLGMIRERVIVWTSIPAYLTVEHDDVQDKERRLPGQGSIRKVKVLMNNGDILDLVEYSAVVMRNDSKQRLIIEMLIDLKKL